MSGGPGDDTITNNNYSYKDVLYKYTYGDGNDTITGFGANDTLNIIAGTFTATIFGNDLIITLNPEKLR